MNDSPALTTGIADSGMATSPPVNCGTFVQLGTASDPTDKYISTSSKIMIVDDEPSSAKIVERYLYDVGYRDLLTVTDPTKVIGEIRRSSPDLVLLDIMMPEVGGIEILQALQRDPDLCHTPVIVQAAAVDPQTKQAALQLRVSDFLSKPVDPHELIPHVRNTLIIKAHQRSSGELRAEARGESRATNRRTGRITARSHTLPGASGGVPRQ